MHFTMLGEDESRIQHIKPPMAANDVGSLTVPISNSTPLAWLSPHEVYQPPFCAYH